MHPELALNRCKLVSAMIETSLKLQISMRNESLFWTKFLPYFIKASQVTTGAILEATYTCNSVRTRAVQTLPWALTAMMYWSKTTTHNHIISPMVLVLPFWVCARKDKVYPVQQGKLSTTQALAGTHPAWDEQPATRKVLEPQKKALPHSEPCLSPATARGTKDCPYYMQQEGSQPALGNGAGRDSSHKQ